MIVHPFEIPPTLRLLTEVSPPAEPALAIGAPSLGHPEPVGREQALAQLIAQVNRVSETGSALLVRGAPGAGKSALVAALVKAVRDQPVAILRASGIRAEAKLPYAGLHQLLRPVLGELGSLPRPQRRAIEAALRMTGAPPPDSLMIAVATLDLLSIAARQGLVIVVEDAQWLDRRTSRVLSFVARRLLSDRIVLLMTARDDRRAPILEAGLDELCLQDLGEYRAAHLVAERPAPVSSRSDAPPRSANDMEPEQPDDPARTRPIVTRDATSANTAGPPFVPDLISLAGDDGGAMLAGRLPSIIGAAGRYEHPDASPKDLLQAGIAWAISGDVARSAVLLARAAPGLQGDDVRPLLSQLLVTQSWNDIHLGRWAEADSEVAQSAKLASETQQATWSVFGTPLAPSSRLSEATRRRSTLRVLARRTAKAGWRPPSRSSVASPT